MDERTSHEGNNIYKTYTSMPQKKDTVNFTMCRAIRLHSMRIKVIGRKLKEELQNTRGPFITTSKSFYKKRLYKESEGKAKERGITHAMKGGW